MRLFSLLAFISIMVPFPAYTQEVKQFDLLQTHKVAAFVATFPTINQFNDRLVADGITPLFAVPPNVSKKHVMGASGMVLEQQVLELKNNYPEHYKALEKTLKDSLDIKSNPLKEMHDFGTPEEWGAYGDRVLLAHGDVSAGAASKNLKMMNDAQAKTLKQLDAIFDDNGFNEQTINGISAKEYAKKMVVDSVSDTKDIVSSYALVPQHDRDIVEPFKVKISVQLLKYN